MQGKDRSTVHSGTKPSIPHNNIPEPFYCCTMKNNPANNAVVPSSRLP